MGCEGKLKLRSHNTSYYLMEVVIKAGLTVYIFPNKKWGEGAIVITCISTCPSIVI